MTEAQLLVLVVCGTIWVHQLFFVIFFAGNKIAAAIRDARGLK